MEQYNQNIYGDVRNPVAANTANSVMANATKPADTSIIPDLIKLLLKIAAIGIAFVLIFSFVFSASRYNDLSMMPAVKDGDMLLTYRWDKSYTAGDICVFDYDGETICSRVVAVEGDKVDIDAGGLKVNDAKYGEQNIYKETTQVKDGVTFPLTVPEGCVFVLGDNRTDSIDSRIFGCVDVQKTQGKVIGLFRHRGL